MIGWSDMLFSGASLWLAEQSAAQGFDNPANRTLVISTAIVVALIVAVALINRSKIGLVPSGMGAIFEHIYEFVLGMAEDMMGPVGRRFAPFCMSIFLFVLIDNWSGLLPFPAFSMHDGHPEPVFECPTVSFNTTLAMAMVSFLAINFYGLRKHMFGTYDKEQVAETIKKHGEIHVDNGNGVFFGFFTWLGHFLHPTPSLWREMKGAMRYLLVPILGCLFVVLNVIEETARLISLSIRLYGNLHGEHTVKSSLVQNMQDFLATAQSSLGAGSPGGFIGYGLMGILLWACSLFVTCIGTLAGFIQAYVFFVLTLSYISHVAADEH